MTIAELKAKAAIVKNETAEHQNTANRTGELFENVIDFTNEINKSVGVFDDLKTYNLLIDDKRIHSNGSLITDPSYRVWSYSVVKGLYHLTGNATGSGYCIWALYNDINCTDLHTLGDIYQGVPFDLYIDVSSSLYLGITKYDAGTVILNANSNIVTNVTTLKSQVATLNSDNTNTKSFLDNYVGSIILNSSDWTNSGYIAQATGAVAANADYVYSNMYKCYEGIRISLTDFYGSNTVRKVEFFDKDLVSLSGGRFISSSLVGITIAPINTRYVRFCTQKYNSGILQSSTSKAVFENTNYTVSSLNTYINDLTIYSSDWTNSGYIAQATGAVATNADYVYSNMYECNEGIRLTFSNFYGSNAIRKVEFFDKNLTAITDNRVITNNLLGSVIAPINTKYVRFCVSKFVSGVLYNQPSNVKFSKWERRQSKNLATLADFNRLENSLVSNQGIYLYGTQTWRKYLQMNVDTYVENNKFSVGIKVLSLPNSLLAIGIGRFSSDTTTNSELRITNTDLELWFINYGVSETLQFQMSLGAITVASGTELVIEMYKTTDGVVCSVTDGTTTISKTVSKTIDSGMSDEISFAKCWGNPYLSLKHGEILVKNISFSSEFDNYNSSVGIWGDSFIEGATMIPYGLENRYCAKIASVIGSPKTPIFGKGGQKLSEDWFYKFTIENDWFRPKYVIVALGTNNNSTENSTFKATLLKVIAHIKKCKQIPILVTVTPRPYAGVDFDAFRVDINAWIRTTVGERYIDVAKAVTNVGDESTWRTGYVLADLIHPTSTGHNAVFIQAKLDVPEIFNS